MNIFKGITGICRILALSLIAFQAIMAGAADTNTIHLAVGPFFATPGDEPLAKIASAMPDLLTASLSQQDRFQLVERDKVNAIWNELHLAEAGLTSADTVGKLGHLLSCDWLVSGSVVRSGSGIVIWVKVIDTQSSVVLDLQAVPYNATDLPANGEAIAQFLAHAGSNSHSREFIAIGRFEDSSVSTTRENWAPKIVAIIEKHFLAEGYGIVERDAMGPIYSEYEFQNAGLTADSSKRVKLKPAFWIVDGGCKWIHTTEDKISVLIHFNKMGQGEQLLSFSATPDEVEQATVDTLNTALGNHFAPTEAKARDAEQKDLDAKISRMERDQDVEMPSHYSTNIVYRAVTMPDGTTRQIRVDVADEEAQQRHAQEMLKTLQDAILLNPKDWHAKFALGFSWFCSTNDLEKEKGRQMLEEVAASGDPHFALQARHFVDDVESGRLEIKVDSVMHTTEFITHGQPESYPTKAQMADMDAKAAQQLAVLNAVTNILTLSSPVNHIVGGEPVEYQSDNGSANLFGSKDLYIASGSTLMSYDLNNNAILDINLPASLTQNITCVEGNDDDLWVGTSDGLWELSGKNGVREYGEKDGFPSSSITALRLIGQKLFIGFGYQNSGGLGYLDLNNNKFIGMMGAPAMPADWIAAMQNPPDNPVTSICTLDGDELWVASQRGVQHYDAVHNQWLAATAGAGQRLLGTAALNNGQMDVNSKYLVVPEQMRCVAVCRLPGTNWTTLNLTTNMFGDEATAVALDKLNPDYLWIGRHGGQVTLVDLVKNQIVAQGMMAFEGDVIRILPASDKVIIVSSYFPQLLAFHSINSSTFQGVQPPPPPPYAANVLPDDKDITIIPSPSAVAHLEEPQITAACVGKALGKGPLLLACGTKLKSYDLNRSFGPGSSVDFEDVPLPLTLYRPITAIATDSANLWLGTDGGGLVQIPQDGSAPRTFEKKDGLPFSTINSLYLAKGRLMIGFGSASEGGTMGYLDESTLKYIPLSKTEPSMNVSQIQAEDDNNTFWVAEDQVLYKFKLDSQQWDLALIEGEGLSTLPSQLQTLTLVGGYTAFVDPTRGLRFRKMSDSLWTPFKISNDPEQNRIVTVTIDSFKPNHLWIGSHGAVTVADMDTKKIIGRCKMTSPGLIEYIVVDAGDVFFIGAAPDGRSFDLYHMPKPF